MNPNEDLSPTTNTESVPTEFWETNFISKQEMWGLDPTNSALITSALFAEQDIKNILIPGIGYGRNAQPFIERGISVTGIEISQTAINMARKHYGDSMAIYHGSVTDMPFDQVKYDGIFCYGLIHLLDEEQRKKLIADSYEQLSVDGYMVFTAVTTASPSFGRGTFISEHRYEVHEGVQIYFYDREAITAEFGDFGVIEVIEVNENLPFYLVTCKKLQ